MKLGTFDRDDNRFVGVVAPGRHHTLTGGIFRIMPGLIDAGDAEAAFLVPPAAVAEPAGMLANRRVRIPAAAEREISSCIDSPITFSSDV
jgi:hypothetical protein